MRNWMHHKVVAAGIAVLLAAAADDFDGTAEIYADYKQRAVAASGRLKLAEPWSLFNPTVHQAHFSALKKLADMAK